MPSALHPCPSRARPDARAQRARAACPRLPSLFAQSKVLLGRSAGARRTTSPAVTGTVAFAPAVTGTVATSPAVIGTGVTSSGVIVAPSLSLAATGSWTPRRPPQRVA